MADGIRGRPVAPDATLVTGYEHGLMAKALSALFAAGATLALLTVALPHSQGASTPGLLAIIGSAYLVAALLFAGAASLPGAILPPALGCGTALITGVAYFSGESPSPLVFFYLWIFLYSAYFFTLRETTAQLLCVGMAYGALLIARPPAGGTAAWWFVGMGTMAVAGILVRVMRGRTEQLIARLSDAARTDPLTNLFNRRSFRELLDLELARARRADTRMTLLIGDLDHFKEVNDRSGHQVGDAVLQRVGRLLERNGREIDCVARVGGEEFALALPDTDEHGAFVIAERLRDALQEEFASDVVPITISFGVASYPVHGETAASLVRAADEAMYVAKENGRNRTVVHGPGMRELMATDDTRDIAAERFLAVIIDLAEAVDLRFSGSARHSETVGRYAAMMARELGLGEQRASRVRLAGLLHDIGKVGIPDTILRKPGKLTDTERRLIQQHPDLGAQILEHPSLADVRLWVGAHHERPDGKGYPLGRSGEEIPLEARIIAVADAYEAMTSDRPYRPALSPSAAAVELRRHAGTQFDRLVVDTLLSLIEREARRAETALTLA
ncbi:MAG TPA: diguanylate cyclase [Solirubrobacteraceae bacterium]|nr:diguanylate cyclase [Solirubrobacteraceae bacterium]